MSEGGWEKTGLTRRNREKDENRPLFERQFHKNKDWNNMCWIHSFKPTMFERQFHKNKDWNFPSKSRESSVYSTVRAPVPQKQGLKQQMLDTDPTSAIVRAPVPQKQGLKRWTSIWSMRSTSSSSASSTKTRIETNKTFPLAGCDHWGSSASSTKTRIETWWPTRYWTPRRVRAPVPQKQGLKLISVSNPDLIRQSSSASSTKTRIETTFWDKTAVTEQGSSASSTKTRIETASLRLAESSYNVRAPVPQKQGLKHLGNIESGLYALEFERQFHKNKDWNMELWKPQRRPAPFERQFHKNKDWNRSKRRSWCRSWKFERQFHKNKDWNRRHCRVWSRSLRFERQFHKNKDWNATWRNRYNPW